jgi:MYXO-CTERM domain-containing protein
VGLVVGLQQRDPAGVHGYGDENADPVASCVPLTGYADNASDCDDTDPAVFDTCFEPVVDSDQDGVPDDVDVDPLNPDDDGDGIDTLREGTDDLDGDGLPNYADEDSDGDGIPDADEVGTDADCDGLDDFLDATDDANCPEPVYGCGGCSGSGSPPLWTLSGLGLLAVWLRRRSWRAVATPRSPVA